MVIQQQISFFAPLTFVRVAFSLLRTNWILKRALTLLAAESVTTYATTTTKELLLALFKVLFIYESFLPLLLIGLTIPKVPQRIQFLKTGLSGHLLLLCACMGYLILVIPPKRTLIDDLAHLQMPNERKKP